MAAPPAPAPPLPADDDRDDPPPAPATDDHPAEEHDPPPLPAEPAPPVVHKGAGDWQAVWSADAGAYYFWNSSTQSVTWENPLAAASSSSSSTTTTTAAPLPPSDTLNGIDPDLAFLDPTLSSATSSSLSAGRVPAFQARFNARTGRFQADPSMTPDRISEYSRAERQQGAYYDVAGWNESLQGRGIKRAAEEQEGVKRKKVTAKDVEKFKQKKLEKKKAKLSWLKE